MTTLTSLAATAAFARLAARYAGSPITVVFASPDVAPTPVTVAPTVGDAATITLTDTTTEETLVIDVPTETAPSA